MSVADGENRRTEDIKKEDCINHIAKCMKNGIMNLRNPLIGTKGSISGKRKGHVTLPLN